MNEESSKKIVDFLFEVGILQNTPRSGNLFLGSGNQTVGSHIFRTVLIGFVLSKIVGADTGEVMKMCLFHDIEETRTGDINYLQQRYVVSDDSRALRDIVSSLPFGDEIVSTISDYERLDSLEAKIAKDSDTLELIFYLKEQLDKGNSQAQNWIDHAKKRLLTDEAKKLIPTLQNSNYYDWWYNLTDEWHKGNKGW